jgi:hypothetical protein
MTPKMQQETETPSLPIYYCQGAVIYIGETKIFYQVGANKDLLITMGQPFGIPLDAHGRLELLLATNSSIFGINSGIRNGLETTSSYKVLASR